MTPKQTRMAVVAAGLAFMAAAAGLALTVLEDNIVFFRAPSELAEKPARAGEVLRVGGLIALGSVTRDGLNARFQVTDLVHSIDVRYEGMLPDLFREGQGVVAEGRFDDAGVFRADTVLAKHDETYMPPEVADALKAAGRWEPGNADALHPDGRGQMVQE